MARNRVKLLRAKVGHERFQPKKNKFIYKVFYIETPVTKNGEPDSPGLFSLGRWNVFSLKAKDNGARDAGVSWHSFVEQQFADVGHTLRPEWDIHLISHPRILGYAFNPISYWLITDKEALRAVICEVHNTFGDTHNYFLAKKKLAPIRSSDVLTVEKKLYVSPFNEMSGRYEFVTSYAPGKSFSSTIRYFDKQELQVNTYMGGDVQLLTNGWILRSLISYPAMTIRVVLRIHWQALRLVVKRVPLTLKRRPREYESDKTTKGDQV